MAEDYLENSEEELKNETGNNNSSPARNPFADGNLKRQPENRDSNTSDMQDGNMSFIIFLILILLLMGNTDSFNTHFQFIDSEVNKITKILEAVSVTNQNLQNVVKAPQEVMQSLKGFNN